jgi:hypothetical protein
MFFAIGCFVIVMFTMLAAIQVRVRSQYGIGLMTHQSLSWPARQILSEYRALPEDNRPYANILEVVTALDTKYGKDNANSHFRVSGYESSHPSWHCTCNNRRYTSSAHTPCKFKDYKDIHLVFVEIQTAITEREHKLALQRVEGGLDAAKELTARLRAERDLIKDVTKELV